MAKQKQTQTQGEKQQGDNRQAGDVDGNRGADPKRGTQGVNQTAANQAGGDNRADDHRDESGRTGGGTEHDKTH